MYVLCEDQGVCSSKNDVIPVWGLDRESRTFLSAKTSSFEVEQDTNVE